MGIDLMAVESSQKLIAIAAIVNREGQSLVKPSVYLSPIAQPHSNNPAIAKYTHAMNLSFLLTNNIRFNKRTQSERYNMYWFTLAHRQQC
jgi:hypothetical protein